jgi:hypothetical protein
MPSGEFFKWKGHRVWLRLPAPTSTRQFGEVMHVFVGATRLEDVDMAIELEDGTIHKVRASEKGTTWDLAD